MTASGDDARVLSWSQLPVDRPMDRIERRRIIGTHAMISRVHLQKGFALASHHHANEQFICVMSGRASFVLWEGTDKARTVTLTGGDVLHVPPHVPHSCVAHEDSEIWDIFSPPSATTGVDRA